jgi:hypothetical protein
MARHLGRVLLLLAVAAGLALLAFDWLADRGRAALVLWIAVVAAHLVILAVIVVTAWLGSQPPPRHRTELVLRRRAWSGLAVAVALVALFSWLVVAQRGGMIVRYIEY